MANTASWKKTAVATVVATVLGLASATPSWALSLGALSVQSAVGEPLRAEIEFADLSDEEAAGLKVELPAADIYRAAGLEYTASLDQLNVQLLRRDNGQRFLRLQGQQPVANRYLDLVLQLNWSAGRIMRNYTLLLSPPPDPQPAKPVLPQSAPTPAPTPVPSATDTPPAATPPAAAAPPTLPAAAAPAPATPAPSPAPAKVAVAGPHNVHVKYGDTAGHIALDHLPEGVSLDQMLVALLKANPDAFVQDNMNRLKTGAVLNMPDVGLALATPQPEARRIVLAQSRDFNAYRRKLAAAAPKTTVGSPAQKVQGKIETIVEDKKSPESAQDKLTLSKGTDTKAAPTAEDTLSKQANEQEAAQRAAELNKNIHELNKLSAEAGAPAPTPTPPAAPAPAVAPTVKAEPPPVPPAAEEEPFKPHTLMDELTGNPAIPAATAALLLLLAALGIYRMRRRQRQAAEPLSAAVLEELPPEEEAPPAMEPTFVPPAAPEVPAPVIEDTAPQEPETPPEPEPPREVNLDPIAEADVYLAYGRADQAEQILQKAIAETPDRMALHLKLLEIYMQQLDLGNFETTAREVQQLTGGQGDDWQRACDMGISIDPDNPLYQPPAADAPVSELDLDLPLETDTLVGEEPPVEAPAQFDAAETLDELALDDLNVTEVPDPGAEEAPAADSVEAITEPVTEEAIELAVPPDEIQPMGFDLSSLSLDLETPPSSEPAGDADPMEVKLALAEEFGVIGDTDGARSLLEEVIAEAQNEDVKARAEEALKKLR